MVRRYLQAATLAVSLAQQPPRLDSGVPVVAPDGRRITFLAERGEGTQLFVIDADGTHEARITSGVAQRSRPVWREDGQSIVFGEAPPGSTAGSLIVEARVDGSGRRQRGSIPGRNPLLFNRDRRVLYVAGGWNNAQLFVSALDGSGARRISDGTGTIWTAALSPNGRQIAYTRADTAGQQIAIWVMNIDGTDARPVTHFTPAEGRPQGPAWSPDGKRLAFQAGGRSPKDPSKNAVHIWLLELATGKLSKLAPHDDPYLDETPAWFPDGKRLAFQSNRTGRMEVWSMRSDGSDVRQITGL